MWSGWLNTNMEGSLLIVPKNWHNSEFDFNQDNSFLWTLLRMQRVILFYVIKYTFFVLVPNFRVTSVFGFALIINMITQMWSGILLSLYYVPDPSFVITFREEYMNEIWWFFFVYKTHVIGVDSIFILSYLHIFKKIFIKNYIGVQLDGWTSGTYAFLIYHVVVFLGITLSTNHLGDLTLTIGATIFWSLFAYKHKILTLLFTNRHLNIDQLIRFMVAHYLMAWYYIYLVQVHVMYIHEMWDADSGLATNEDPNSPKSNWGIDAFQKETMVMVVLYIICMSWSIAQNHPDVKPVNFSFFEQWAETEYEDINFFIVGPHWYFRPHMGLLTVCAQHYEGLFWLVAYYVILSLMPLWSNIFRVHKDVGLFRENLIPMKDSWIQLILFIVFIVSLLYAGGTLPCARFYYDEEDGFFGNMLLRWSYQYVYTYLLLTIHIVDKLELMYRAAYPKKDNEPKINSSKIKSIICKKL